MEPLTFDSSDLGLIEATVSKLYSKLDIVTIADIARAAYVTPRALQLAFRRHLDTTPLAYLRRVRLHHAHQDLAQADPGDGTTVTSVSYWWGFPSPSRFAASYRVPPSDTLRR